MILTEDEAKTKWCPYFQVSTSVCGEYSNQDVQVNRNLDSTVCNCVASKCMAWCWVKMTNIIISGRCKKCLGNYYYEYKATGEQLKNGMHCNCGDRQHHSKPTFVQKGYCGLAGKPEGVI